MTQNDLSQAGYKEASWMAGGIKCPMAIQEQRPGNLVLSRKLAIRGRVEIWTGTH